MACPNCGLSFDAPVPAQPINNRSPKTATAVIASLAAVIALAGIAALSATRENAYIPPSAVTLPEPPSVRNVSSLEFMQNVRPGDLVEDITAKYGPPTHIMGTALEYQCRNQMVIVMVYEDPYHQVPTNDPAHPGETEAALRVRGVGVSPSLPSN